MRTCMSSSFFMYFHNFFAKKKHPVENVIIAHLLCLCTAMFQTYLVKVGLLMIKGTYKVFHFIIGLLVDRIRYHCTTID
jgi:hypothetical protein